MTWEAAREFAAESLYLNTASMGLPPRVTREALAASHDRWARGRAEAGDYDEAVERARMAFARLVHVDHSRVAVGHQVAPLVGLVAAALPDDAEVLVAEEEFTSVSFPFAAHADRGIRVVERPLAELAAYVGPRTAAVAVSAVQSGSGAVADLDAITEACQRHDAWSLVDLTQSAGWLDVDASRFDAAVCGAYKWLLSPRGSAFLALRPGLADRVRPLAASWYAGEDPWTSIYGLPLRLASDARRFDISPGWHAWVGTAASLDFLTGIGIEALHGHALEVAGTFSAAAGLDPPESAILSLGADSAQVGAILAEHDVLAAHRAGRLRVSFHVNNTVEEVEPLGEALRGHVLDNDR